MSIFADLHCHPSFKPYGQSFSNGNNKPSPQSTDINSLWHLTQPNLGEKVVMAIAQAATYTQSSMASAAAGGLQIVGLSLGALEKEFITISQPIPAEVVKDLSVVFHADIQNALCNAITRCGLVRLQKVRDTKDYLTDLENEFKFVTEQQKYVFEHVSPTPGQNKFYQYKLAANGAEVNANIEHNKNPNVGKTAANPVIISMTLSVEGLHNLNANFGIEWDTLSDNVHRLKRLNPFFVTFCHHFWNGLCGHARSLTNVMAAIFDQKNGRGEPFNVKGLKVLKMLLDKNVEGKRVLIDIKHLSQKARIQYYNLMRGSVPDDVAMTTEERKELTDFFKYNLQPGHPNNPPPVIVSHAAVNGHTSDTNFEYQGNYPHPAGGVQSPFENMEFFGDPSINLFDTDLESIIQFDCLVGIQLDKRRMADDHYFQYAQDVIKTHYQAFLVWNQVLHMVELWDAMNVNNAWDHVCIGSDFDGIINPIDNLNRLSDYPHLREGLLHYCKLYMMSRAEFVATPGHAAMGERGQIANRDQISRRTERKRMQMDSNISISAEEIVDKICYKNALNFMVKYFK